MNILFVCTGNTCRSPMAEGYLRAKNTQNINASSCGLFADGSPVSQNSALAMDEIQIDISSHISKQITKADIENADRIICMSPSHKQTLESIGVTNAEVLGGGIFDPYGQDLESYRLCRDQIIKEIDKLFPNVTVSQIEHRHIKEIARLEKECFSTPWSEQTIEDAFKTGTRFFVAQKDNSVLGYVGISAILDEGYITNVAVLPEARQQGVASALLNSLFEFAKENSLSFISLEVRESNNAAISLYQKFGFKTEGKRKNFYSAPQEDALIMTKRFD
jgi:ribosomal-protein-alanine N-acetyltransferase